jgi:hypothetical protein
MQKDADLAVRTKNFALQIIRLSAQLPKTTEAQVLRKQLLRLELLEEAKIASANDFKSPRRECDELTAIFVTILRRSKETLS